MPDLPEPGRQTSTAEPPRVWLVRHGETEWSRSGQHTGRTDLALTVAGRRQARRLGRRLAGLSFGTVLSSPRRRALETCELAGPMAEAIVDPDLAEWDYGVYEGRTTAEVRTQIPGWTVWSHPIEGGESLAALAARTDRVIDRIRGEAGPVAVFGHGHQLRVLGARWIGLPAEAAAGLLLGTASISVLGWDRGRPAIANWNIEADPPTS